MSIMAKMINRVQAISEVTGASCEAQVEELSRYKVLFYPHPLILTQERADLLKAYVEQGGILILGARTGQKDLTGQCVMQPMPGILCSSSHLFLSGRSF